MKVSLILAALALVLFIPSCARAQQTSITGTVTDSQGGTLPNATVHLNAMGGGVSLTSKSNADGIYIFPSVEATDYIVEAEFTGFATVKKQLRILVGQVVTADFSLPIASATSSVEVTTEMATISTTTSEVAGNIDPIQMKEVPLNGRNWLELALLIPGVVKNDVDGLSPVVGDDGGSFQINLDGQQTTQDLTGASTGQPRYSRDAISQYQIITNRFDATQGRSLNMMINAQTKSGSNAFHGVAFAYFRNSALIAKDFVAKTNLPYSDQQYGGTFGGPILKNKLWFFGSYEGERTPQTYYMTPIDFNGETFTQASTTTIKQMVERMDYQRSNSTHYFFRVSGYTQDNPYAGLSGSSVPSRAYSSANKAFSSLLGADKTLSPTMVNELRLGFAYFNYSNVPLYPSQQYDFSGITVGAPYNYPGLRFQNTWSARDDFFWSKGKHSIKLGGEYLNDWSHGIFEQNFSGTVQSFTVTPGNLAPYFPNPTDPTTWNLAYLSTISSNFVQGFGDDSLSIYRSSIGLWFQDDWKVLTRLTLNLGVRYDVDLGMEDSSITLKSGLATPHTNDWNNVAPRFGLAYDVFGSHKTVIRGGAGIFFADVQANQYYDQQIFNGQTSLQASVSSGTGNINLNTPFGAYTPTQILSGAIAFPQAVQLVDPSVTTPWAAQGSIGVAQQLGSKWTVQADYAKFRIHRQWIRFDQNQTYNPVTGYEVTATGGKAPLYANSGFTNILRFVTPPGSSSLNDELLIDVHRAFANGFMVAGAYTLARGKSTSDGAFDVPDNQFNLKDEWGPVSGDQRHTFNVNGLYQMKYGFELGGLFRAGSGAAYGVTAGSNPFGNGTTENRTFLATAKVYNNPAEIYASTAAGYDLVRRNSFYGRPVYRVDGRLQKTFSLKERYKLVPIVEVFNMLNHPNYGAYSTSITSNSYGTPVQDTSQSYCPRTIQFAGRFEF